MTEKTGHALPDRSASRFTIRWTDQGYKVSVPNLDTAEVVLASTYERDVDAAIKVIEAREKDMYDAMADADRLRAENEALRRGLVHVYLAAPVPVARACDLVIDPSGRLLGEVRRAAKAALASDEKGHADA